MKDLVFDMQSDSMESIECTICHKEIKHPTEWNLMVHEKFSERHKKYLHYSRQ